MLKSGIEVGQKFDYFTVKEFMGSNNIQKLWKIVCVCGNERIWSTGQVKRNKSCGCISSPRQRGEEKFLNKKFYRLTITKYLRSYKENAIYEYICECGKIGKITSYAIGRTQSCGCLKPNRNHKKSFTGYKDISGKYFGGLQRRAKYKKIDFNLTLEYIWGIFEKQNFKCALTGRNIYFDASEHKDKKKFKASVDRIDSSKGYIQGNIQILDATINIMKMDLSQQSFIENCIMVSNKFNKEKTNE